MNINQKTFSKNIWFYHRNINQKTFSKNIWFYHRNLKV